MRGRERDRDRERERESEGERERGGGRELLPLCSGLGRLPCKHVYQRGPKPLCLEMDYRSILIEKFLFFLGPD